MKPRELDAFIAEHLEGFPLVWAADPFRVPDRRLTDVHPWIHGIVGDRRFEWKPVAKYSSDWREMERLIAKMHEHGWDFVFVSKRRQDHDSGGKIFYCAAFVTAGAVLPDLDAVDFSEGDILPLAVSRAAVAALKNTAHDSAE